MRQEVESVLRTALSLPESDRAEIAGALLESLEPSTDSDIETAWRREVAARISASDAGQVSTIPWEEVRERLLMRLSERRAD